MGMESRPIVISIIIPIYGNFNLLNNLLNTLMSTIDDSCEIIIIDDGPLNEKLDSRMLSSNIIYLSNEENKGYAYSVNKGVNIARGDIITTINSDICVEPGWVEKTKEAFDSKSDIGILGALLRYPSDGAIQHCGVFFSTINYMHHAFSGRKESPLCRTGISEVPAVTFAFASFLKKDWETVGGLDDNYYNSHEDIDFCMKVKYMIRKKIYIHNEILAFHITSASEEQRFLGASAAATFFVERWKHVQEDQGQLLFQLSKETYCALGGLWPKQAVMISIPMSTGRRKGKYYYIFQEYANIETVAYYEYDMYLGKSPRHHPKPMIQLLRVLPFSLLESHWPIIFFVDSYKCLKDNYYWQLKRINKNDMVFDASFNIVSMQELVFGYL